MQIGELDAAYASVFKEGVAFLLDCEHRRGQAGLWVAKTSPVYTRYHAAYCGIVGCLTVGTGAPEDDGTGDDAPEIVVPACFR